LRAWRVAVVTLIGRAFAPSEGFYPTLPKKSL
jgi:hypothetical protein